MVITSFVSARIDSSRLHQKCLLPFGDCNVLQHGIRRARDNGLNPIVCTPSTSENDVIADMAVAEGVKCFRGQNDDRLRRWLDCAVQNNVSAFHTVDVDDPFFDPRMMKRSFSLLVKENLDYVEPTKLSSAGNACVCYSLKTAFVKKACDLYPPGKNSELMWHYLEAVDGYRSKVLPQSNLCSDSEVRLTLDYEEDYWLLQSICRILGNNAGRAEVDQLFRENPVLKDINWFRNDQWKDNQSLDASSSLID